MELDSFLKRHPSLCFADEFQSVCSPLFKLGLDYFSHIRINGNNQLTANGSHPEYFQFYFEQEYQHFDIHAAQFNIPQRYIAWNQIETRGKAQELYKITRDFGIDNVFTIFEQSQGVKNYYNFGIHPLKTHMHDFYSRHLDLLEQFVLYYKNCLVLNDRINRAYTLACPFTADSDSYIIKEASPSYLSSKTINDFLECIKQTKDVSPFKQLPKRELQCALYLLEGKTSAEIAELLYISQRTVEVYMIRLKERFGSKNKIQLVRHLVESGVVSNGF